MVLGLVTKEGTNQSTKHVIFISKAPSLYNLSLDLKINQASTYSGARHALFGVTNLPAALNTLSLLLLATGWGR